METPDRRKMYLALLKGFGPLIAIGLFLAGAFIYDSWGVKWVRGEYHNLVNGGLLVQSGSSLKEVMAKYTPADRNQVQPFLDSYSQLLDEMVAMERGKESMGFTPICDVFTEGTPQPAWAAIVRSGSIHISSDGKGRVRVFLPVTQHTGNVDAQKEYLNRYSVLRHPLSWLSASNNGVPLNIEVLCFNNDYGTLTLNLSMQSHTFSESHFPSKFSKPLNLNEIEKVLARAARIKGAKLGEGSLELAVKDGAPMTIAGSRVSLSDLAIAYRACFYSGANEPYVSLDRHWMPTKVAVNFGGYMEDTRIGSVLLEADKRFKSFSTGLSPDGIADISASVKAVAPSFASEDERSFLRPNESQSGWQGTRFWFYPDSISIETDLSGRLAVVSSPRFTADAERSMDDIRKLGLAKESAKKLLAPETRAAIDQLNVDYDKLALVFPELLELDAVGEVMGLMVWAKQSPGKYQTDLDELLSVELPAFNTPRDKNQLISTSMCIKSGKHDSIHFTIRRASFTEQLKVSFADMQFSQDELSTLLTGTGTTWDTRLDSFGQWSGTDARKTMSELLTSKELVRKFAEVMTNRISTAKSDQDDKAEIARLKALLSEHNQQIDAMESRMNSLKRTEATDQYNALVPVYNGLIGKYRAEVDTFNAKVSAYNARPFVSRTVAHIGGGISVRPSAFKMATVSSSREIETLTKAFNTGQAPEGWVVTGPRVMNNDGIRLSRTPPPATWTQYEVKTGMRASSSPPSGIARDRLLAADQSSLTAVSFKPDGSQESHTVAKATERDGVVTFAFKRVVGTRYIKPSPAPGK